MKSKFTPGPWRVDMQTNSLPYAVFAPDANSNQGHLVCLFSPHTSTPESIIEANAHLIAAAPALLEALQGLLLYGKSLDNSDIPQGNIDYARKIFREVTGRKL